MKKNIILMLLAFFVNTNISATSYINMDSSSITIKLINRELCFLGRNDALLTFVKIISLNSDNSPYSYKVVKNDISDNKVCIKLNNNFREGNPYNIDYVYNSEEFYRLGFCLNKDKIYIIPKNKYKKPFKCFL